MGTVLDPNGPAAESINALWWLLLAVGGAVFVLFCVLLALALLRPQDDRSATGRRRLTRRWVVGGGVAMPLVVLVAVFAATLVSMRALPSSDVGGAASAAGQDPLTIEVTGHQWRFEVRYPDAGVTTEEMHLPVGRRVVLRLTSADVIHSFWVPELGGKRDMLPGDVNTLVVQADEPATYLSQCAEFCGLHHADMQLVVVAEPADAFEGWLAGQG